MRLLLTSVFYLLFGIYCLGQSISSAEYFFNSDPGISNGTALIVGSNTGQLIQTFSIPTTSLPEGIHSLYIRTFNSDNNWSLYDRQTFYLKSLTSSNITSAEYFFNSDPGLGNGIALTVNSNSGSLTQAFSIPINTLSEGFNSLYIRTQNNDGNWSLYDRQVIYIKGFVSNNITAAEYFFNTDPGIGNATALSVESNSGQLTQAFTVSTGSLSEGFHSFYLRTRDSNNNWGLYDRRIIYIKDFDITPDEVSAAEYFIDTDPGVGNGTGITFSDSTLSTQILNVSTTGLADGDHLFHVRVQDTNGDWSIYDSAIFTIDSSLSIEESLFKSINLYPNPVENELIIDLPKNLNTQIRSIEIYNNNGQTVYAIKGNKTNLNLSHLTKGLYILNLKTSLGTASFKVIKK